MDNVNSAMEGGREVKPTSSAFKLGAPGDILKGTLIELTEETSKGQDGKDKKGYHAVVKVEICQYHKINQDEAGNYIAAPDVTVVDTGEEIDVWTNGRADLNELFADAAKGDVIGIQFLGYEKGKGPKPYKNVLTKNFGADPNYKTPEENLQEAFPGAEEVNTTSEGNNVEGVGF